MKTVGQMQALLCDRDQHVSADRDPDLRLDCVLGSSKERLDPQMLFDPFEEQLDLPALTVKVCDQLGFEGEVVGQKSDSFASSVLHHHPTKRSRIVFAGIENRQDARLIADDVGVVSVHRTGVSTLEFGVGLCACHEKGAGLMNHEQPLVIEVASIEQVVRAWLDVQVIQGVDLVRLAIGDVNERWDGAPQIQQGVQFDGSLVRSKWSPRIHREAKVDCGGIEGVDRCVQIDSKRFLRIQRTRHRNQMLSKVGINLPRPSSVCIGQRVARNGLASQAHVIQALGLGPKVDLDVAQGVSVRQLRKSHGQKLVHAGEVLDLVVAPVMTHAPTKSGEWQECHQLRENELALIHGGPLRAHARDHKSWTRSSNRDQTKTPKNQGKSLTYEAPA
jgi:hypothetical protein